ncbi:unnamed protein product [Mytilus edulis]|uniref:Uncharacterized protein n=1 Tax=Mytilus edulis TaxID=6550 RepID=A0A8S3TC87_MYTED|nr:unnamed protein product [Mytilus edulis]
MYYSQVEIEDLDHDDQEPWQISQPSCITTDDVMVQYLKTNKKIPQNIHQPAEFRFNESVNSQFTLKELVPTENSCIQCDVQLRRQELRSIQIVFMNRIDTDEELWLIMAGDPLIPLTFLIPALRDREGFYSGEVIIQTIERRSYVATRDTKFRHNNMVEDPGMYNK